MQRRYVSQADILCQPAVHYAAAFLWRLVEQWQPAAAVKTLDVDSLTWLIMAILQQEQPEDGLAEIRQRLQTAHARYLFSKDMAHIFMGYHVYRPDWLTRWMKNHRIEEGNDEDALWQKALWQRMQQSCPVQYDTHALLDFIHFLAEDPATAKQMLHCPQRIDLFFPQSLAPLYIQAFVNLSAMTQVVFWVMVPSCAYWGDVHTETSQYRSLLRRPEDGYVPVAHRLLSSWGHQCRDLIDCLLNASIACEFYAPQPALVQRAHPATWLGVLQHSVWTLTAAVTMPASPDSSFRIMACHSFARECEILHDALWHLFLADPTLSVADVLIQVPDVAKAAPLIEAAFCGVAPERFIPYALSGSCGPLEPYCDAILSFFRLLQTRFEKSAVLNFLQRPVILHALHLSLDDLRVLDTWLEGVQVHWGLTTQGEEDGVHRVAHHAWSQGLHRLWLTFCLPQQGHWQGQFVASCGPSGEDLYILAACQRVLTIFQEWHKKVQHEQGLTQWLEDVVHSMRIWEPDAHSMVAYQKMMTVIETIKKKLLVSPDMDCQTFLDFFVDQLRQDTVGALPHPVVTIAQYGALRGVPYRVVCCLHMNKGVVPRCAYKTEYNLLGCYPRLGDPVTPLGDKDAFLAAVLSCQYLYLSYQDHDYGGDRLERSTLIDDLLHFFSDQAPFCEETHPFEAVQARLILHHSLHPFTRAAFLHAQLPSVAYEYLCAAPSPPRSLPGRVFSLPLPTDVSWSMDYLASILVHPVRFFLREQRRVRPARPAPVAKDTESLVVTPSQLFGWVQVLFAAPDCMRSVIDPHLPAGYVGQFFREHMHEYVHRLTKNMDTFCPDTSRQTIDFFCTLPARHSIFGRVTQMVAYDKNRWLHFVCCRTSPRYLFQQWIQHVCLQYGLQQQENASVVTVLMQEGCHHVMTPLPYEEAQRLLLTYIQCAQHAHSGPIPFFVKTAYQWVMGQEKETYAHHAWVGSAFSFGESQDMWHRLLFPQSVQALTPQSFQYAHLLWDDFFRYVLRDIGPARNIREIVIEK